MVTDWRAARRRRRGAGVGEPSTPAIAALSRRTLPDVPAEPPIACERFRSRSRPASAVRRPSAWLPLLAVLFAGTAAAQDPFIDSVASFTPGTIYVFDRNDS